MDIISLCRPMIPNMVLESCPELSQVSNKGCSLFENLKKRVRASIRVRLFEGSIGLRESSRAYFIRVLSSKS